jgi:O-antigen ligase
MILRLPRNFLFPLATFAFVADTVQYTDTIFTTSTRWIFLAMLTLYVVAKGRFLAGLLSPFGFALLFYCTWCLTTYTWSEVPELSIAKAAAFSLVSLTFASAGYDWVCERGTVNAINYLFPVAMIALFAGIGGGVNGNVAQRGLQFYEGLTDNPNMLGSLIAMATPILLWNSYKFRTRPQAKWIWIALVAVAAVMLLRSQSRAAMMSAGMLGLGFCLSLKLRRTGFILVLIGGSLLVALVASTAILNTTYENYVLKGVTEDEGGLLATRQGVWDQSYANAEQGGWFGAGYGVTVGDKYFQGGLTSVGYGREKGNAQLAIVEETGLVGLALYSILLLTLFARLVSAHRRERNPDLKVALGIVTGALAGLTILSVFEAWWVSPGSPESAYFWGLAGAGLGLAQSSAVAAKALDPRRIARNEIFSPAQFLPQRRMKG